MNAQVDINQGNYESFSKRELFEALQRFNDVSARQASDNTWETVTQELASLDADYRVLMDNIPGVFWRVKDEPNWPVVYFSSGVKEMTGFSAEEFMNGSRNWSQLTHPDDLNYLVETIGKAVARKEVFDLTYRIIVADNSIHWVREIGVYFQREGEEASFLDGYVLDVTEQKENEDALVRAKEDAEAANRELIKQQSFMAAVMDNVADGIVACDENGMLSLFNRATREFHGVDQKNLPPDQWADQYDLYLADGKTPMQMEEIPLYRAFKENEVKDVEMVIAQKHGNDHFMLASGKALLDESGNKLGAVVSMHDITDQKKYEALLLFSKEEAEAANRAKSIFLANMSHELRTPLNAVLGFSSMLARDPESTRGQRDKLEIINRSGEHLLLMINDVLDLSKIDAGGMDLEPEAFDLPQLLQEIGNMFEMRAQSRDLSFNLELDPNLARYIKADPGKIRQVLINLLGNSAKFTQEGGFALRVSTAPIENAPEVVTLQIEIEDSGPGIPPEQLEHIFEPFVQAGHSSTAVKGTGLGLAITKLYLELMGDDIRVESTVGKGTLFQVEFPVALAEADGVKSVSATLPEVTGLEPGQTEWRILVVEDNPENRLLLISLLNQAGFKVQEAENGEEAVSQFKQWQPHFIWMDIRMPVLDGFGATTQIRALPGGDQVKIVAITASAFKEQRKSILDAGCDEVLHKPFQAHEIFDCMKKHLDVSYIYKTAAESASSPVKQPLDMAKEKALVSSLPEQLRSDLEEAVTLLDVEASYALIEDVHKVLPELADTLKMYVDEFDFDTLHKVLADD
ncbi:MAG: ATP-binding protein [Sedimenticola sp.]